MGNRLRADLSRSQRYVVWLSVPPDSAGELPTKLYRCPTGSGLASQALSGSSILLSRSETIAGIACPRGWQTPDQSLGVSYLPAIVLAMSIRYSIMWECNQ